MADQNEACGCSGNPKFEGVDPAYKRVLWVVIAINAVMFIVEMSAGKLAVMVASVAVWFTLSAWPDLIVAAIMIGLFLRSSQLILVQAWQEYRSGEDMGALQSHGHDHAH